MSALIFKHDQTITHADMIIQVIPHGEVDPLILRDHSGTIGRGALYDI